ncbi:MAG: aldo/keto reductase [Isosphaeraceae bacterium]
MATMLGSTGLSVSRMGLGLASLGRPGYINLGHAGDLAAEYDVEAMERRAHVVLDAAWQAGIRYFDAARSYGRAEEFLASWLQARRIGPDAVTVGTKWGYTYTAGWETTAPVHEIKDHSLSNLQRQSAESREILGSWIKLHQIHSATLESGVLEDPEVLRELSRLRERGWAIGLSVSGVRQRETIERALEVQLDGIRLFDCVQATWNLLERSATTALEAAHDAGLGVIVKEALANGRLTRRNHNPEFAEARRRLEHEARRLGASLDALALAAVLGRGWVDTVLSGATTTDQLDSNVTALGLTWDDEAEAQCSTLVESPESYWSTRARLPWN